MIAKLQYMEFVLIVTLIVSTSAKSIMDERQVGKSLPWNSIEMDPKPSAVIYPNFRMFKPLATFPDDLEKRSLNNNEDGDNESAASERNTQFPKRAPPGVLGVRGKKLLAELVRMSNNNNNNNNNIIEDDLNEETSEVEFKRVPNGFLGMRGKKEFFVSDAQLQTIRQWVLQQREKVAQGEGGGVLRGGAKRDPVKGFMGVRGKRLLERLAGLELESGDDAFKRNAYSPEGFVGMRGKKWDDMVEY